MSVGSFPRDELLALTGLLQGHTSADERCYFAVWDGFGQLHGGSAWSQVTSDGRTTHLPGLVPNEVLAGPRLQLPGRTYLLAAGSLRDGVAIFDALHDQSPNLWWPESRRWCVATEIDFGWTYVGGPQHLVDELVASEDLEAMRTEPTHGVTFASDLLNAALDD